MANTASGSGKLAALEGLRGVLALLVCLGHLDLNEWVAPLGLEVRFDAAVDVFFALSGFVMTRAYYLGRRSFRALAVSRVARLYPLHLLTLVWCLWLTWPKGFDGPLLLQNLALAHNIGLPPNRWAFNFPSWSISVEMAVSLAFFLVMRRDRRWLAGALLVGGLALAASELASGSTPAENHLRVLNSGLMRGLAGFALGAAAYLVARHRPGLAAATSRAALPAALALLAIMLVPEWGWLPSALFALTVFVAVLSAATFPDAPLLSSAPLVWLGAISYSVYLLHIPIAWTVTSLIGHEIAPGAGKAALVALILAGATFCYRAFELPAQRWLLARLAPRPKPQPAPAS